MKKYFPGKPVNVHIKSSINNIKDNNWIIPTKKKGKGELPLLQGNVERLTPIYGGDIKP